MWYDYLIVVLICISLVIGVIEHIFMHPLAIYFLWKFFGFFVIELYEYFIYFGYYPFIKKWL